MIQKDGKGSEVDQFPQFGECRDVCELLIAIARNGGEYDTA
jgi:hypothetical protein